MKSYCIPTILVAGAISLQTSWANHIDFLVDGGFMISADAAGTGISTDTQTGASGNILGSEREVTLRSDLGVLSATLNAPIGSGEVGSNEALALDFAAGDEGLGTLNLLYNGTGSAGLGGLNFASMWDSFAVDLDSVSGGALDLRVTVGDTGGNSGQLALGNLTSGGSYFFPFDALPYTTAGVDFAAVDFVSVDFETIELGTSFSVSSITREAARVPDSGSLLFVTGGTWACLLGWRRRKA